MHNGASCAHAAQFFGIFAPRSRKVIRIIKRLLLLLLLLPAIKIARARAPAAASRTSQLHWHAASGCRWPFFRRAWLWRAPDEVKFPRRGCRAAEEKRPRGCIYRVYLRHFSRGISISRGGLEKRCAQQRRQSRTFYLLRFLSVPTLFSFLFLRHIHNCARSVYARFNAFKCRFGGKRRDADRTRSEGFARWRIIIV